MIVDFGRGPSVPSDQRRSKTSPLRDVASILRSFVHAIAAAKHDLARLLPEPELAAARLREGLIEFFQIFIRAYWEAAHGSPIFIEHEGTRRRLLVLYLLAELLYDIETEGENRPEWLNASIDGVCAILDGMANA